MRFAWGSLLTLVTRLGGALLWLIGGVILARTLPVRDLGIYVATVVAAQAVAAVAASYASATGFFVSNKGRDPAEVASHGLVLGLAFGAVALLVALPAWWIFRQPAILIAGVALFPIVSRHTLAGVFLGQNRLLLFNLGIHSQPLSLALLLCIWAAAPVDHTAGSALLVWLAALYISALLLLPWAKGAWSWIPKRGLNWGLLTAIVTFGGVMGLAGAISYFNYRVDQLLVTGLDSASSAGIYSRAVALAEGLWLLSTSLAIASYAAIGTASRHEAARLTARAVRHTLLVVLAGALVIGTLAPFFLEFLFGARYTPAADSLRILAIGTALFAPQSLLSNYFTVQLGRPWIPMSVAFSSTVINIGLSSLLIPQIGFVGGAWATTVSYAVAGVLSVGAFLKLSDARPSDLWRPRSDDIGVYVRTAREALARLTSLRPRPGRTP